MTSESLSVEKRSLALKPLKRPVDTDSTMFERRTFVNLTGYTTDTEADTDDEELPAIEQLHAEARIIKETRGFENAVGLKPVDQLPEKPQTQNVKVLPYGIQGRPKYTLFKNRCPCN
jgi:hypothetical protein